jgi:hypothetical protein
MSMSRANSWVPGWAGLAHENNYPYPYPYPYPLQRMEIGRLGQVPPNCLPYKDVLVAQWKGKRGASATFPAPSSILLQPTPAAGTGDPVGVPQRKVAVRMEISPF